MIKEKKMTKQYLGDNLYKISFGDKEIELTTEELEEIYYEFFHKFLKKEIEKVFDEINILEEI